MAFSLKLPHFFNALIIRLFIIDRTGLKKMKKFRNNQTLKEVVMIPMSHLEREEYYNNIKKFLDIKKDEGHVVFYEGIVMPSDLELPENDILIRKFRKVMGFYLTDYKNPTNRSIPKAIRRNKYVSQTKEILGLTTESDIHADLSLEDIIDVYEREKGEIILSQYDMTTDLFEQYNPNDKTEYDHMFLIKDVRENHILKMVEQSEEQKIIILYGKAHAKELGKRLIAIGFELIK